MESEFDSLFTDSDTDDEKLEVLKKNNVTQAFTGLLGNAINAVNNKNMSSV